MVHFILCFYRSMRQATGLLQLPVATVGDERRPVSADQEWLRSLATVSKHQLLIATDSILNHRAFLGS